MILLKWEPLPKIITLLLIGIMISQMDRWLNAGEVPSWLEIQSSSDQLFRKFDQVCSGFMKAWTRF